MGVRPLEGQGHSGRGEEAWILRQGEACRRPRTRPSDGEGPPPVVTPAHPEHAPGGTGGHSRHRSGVLQNTQAPSLVHSWA